MPLSRVFSVALIGLDAVPIDIEVDVETSIDRFAFVTVGLPDAGVKESKDRVLAAMKNSGYNVGLITCTINLAPGDLRKEGALYDLPIAVGVLAARNIIPKENTFCDYLIVGELGLGGETRPIVGALAMAMLARQQGKRGLILPAANAREAAAVTGIVVIPVKNLKEAVQFFHNPATIQPVPSSISADLFEKTVPLIDFADIKGQSHVKRALEIAAAGGHNIVMSGPPGSGKTMMAKALIGIMPEPTVQEALETTKIHSIAGLLTEGSSLVTQRPFRSPHHTISYAGLIGGGMIPRPGEVSLAHNGILFLDELPEFSRTVLEVLRQPLEDRKVTISRANGNFTFPTNFLCIAAMNPCPCGMLGHPDKPCKDSALQVDRYRNKISGPLWDRLDMHIEVPALRYRDMTQGAMGESTITIRKRVVEARKRQSERLGAGRTNAIMSSKELRKYAVLDHASEDILRQAVDVMGMSARACDKILRVGRTIADLAGSPDVQYEHMMEALAFRGH
ncbi:MAG: YifB family Mg chelatase-like AAA ATPase [Parachlamydiaceae bacterium]|nr:YifB family Mg chelatase-like AAA ATPase [Parachlamydiaceae bacterium]